MPDPIHKLVAIVASVAASLLSLNACGPPRGSVIMFAPNKYLVHGNGPLCVKPIQYAPGISLTGEPDYRTWPPWRLPVFTSFLQRELSGLGYEVRSEASLCGTEEPLLVCMIVKHHFKYGDSWFPFGKKATVEAEFKCILAEGSQEYFERTYSATKSKAHWFIAFGGVDWVVSARASEKLFEEVVREVVIDVSDALN